MIHHLDEERIRQLRRLILAEQSMLVIMEACQRELAKPDSFNQCGRMLLSVGIATLYSSPFTNASELGPLEATYSKFENEQLRLTHDRLLGIRNEAYAHRDYANATIQMADKVEKMHQVRIMVDHIGNIRHGTFRLYFVRPELEKALELCTFQQYRLAKKASKLLARIAKHKIISPGDYILGENFP